MTPVLRFAPSPNGRLHLGHAYSALLNAEIAERIGGRLLLRIEDIDRQRSKPELVAAIEEDLAWLGLQFDGMPWRQSQCMPVYAQALDRLEGGGLVYRCFCSRGQLAAAIAERVAAGRPVPRDPDGTPLYPRTCRALSRAEIEARCAVGEAHALRLDMARALAAEPGPYGYRRFAKPVSPTVPVSPLAGQARSHFANGLSGSPPPCGEEWEVGVVPPASDGPSGSTPTPGPSPPGGGEKPALHQGFVVHSKKDESARLVGRGSDAARPESAERSRSADERTLLSIEAPADPARWGDVVIARRDVPTSYHLSVVIDDSAQGITHVVRGQDLEAATDLHVLLQRLLGLARPLYHHHALIRASSGEKLAKSKGSTSLADLRGAGYGPGEVRAMLGFAA